MPAHDAYAADGAPLSRGVAVELETGHDYEGAFVSADGRHGLNLQPGDKVLRIKVGV